MKGLFQNGVIGRLSGLVAGFIFLLLLSHSAVAGERRVAFVVGNSAYESVPKLPNTRNDAEAVAAALRKSGFEVVTAFDLKQAEFDNEFQRFVRSLTGADISLFYYSGHGIQVGGDNRIIPIDAKLTAPQDMEVETVGLQTILSYMRSNSKSQIVYLDSCRNNPFPSSKFLVGPDKEMAPAGVGLAPEKATAGSLIAFSTQPGDVAVDGTGEMSPFTESMVKHSFSLGVDIQSALIRVTQEVWEATDHRQRPWSSNTLVEPVYLVQPTIVIASDGEPPAQIKMPSVVVGAEDSGAGSEEQLPPATAVRQIAGLLESALDRPRRVPIGVGAVAMLGDLPVLRGNSGTRIEINKVPATGVLYLDDKVLTEGAVIDQASLTKVKFEPSIGSDGRVDDFQLKVSQADDTAAVPGKVETFLVDCDREAGEPLDLQGVSPGKLPNEIDAGKAIAACSEATAKFPEVARYKYELGRAKLAGNDLSGAIDLFNAAAQGGHIRAYYQLGHMAQRGQGRPQDLEEANKLYRIGADRGDPFAMLSYGRNLTRGRGVTADLTAGVALLNRSVELGHTYAMNELGSMYFYGRGVKANPKRGIRFYEAGLARNDIYSINNMALAYIEGKGVKRDAAIALALFKRASDGGHPSAPNNIGLMYFNGDGVKKDSGRAIEWYALGAERGDSFAASNLARIYTKGPSKLRDVDKAVWYSSLAKAVDIYGENPEAGVELRSLPSAAKARAIKRLTEQLDAASLETASDLDGTLVLLSRKLWQKQNPRFDLF